MKVRLWNAHQQTDVPLGETPVVVGRTGGTADVTLTDERMSRRHGKVWARNGQAWYEDLGSQNGSFVYGDRLKLPIQLAPEVLVVMGHTALTLLPSQTQQMEKQRVDGMDVMLQPKTAVLGEAMASSAQSVAYVSALFDFVKDLLGSTSTQLMVRALKCLHRAVRAAERMAMVAWPPEANGRVRLLIPDEQLKEHGVRVAPISTSLAKFAAEKGQAVMLSAHSMPDIEVGESVLVNSTQNAIYVPLMDLGGTAVVAMLCVDSTSPLKPFSPQDFDFICVIAGLVGTALAAEGLKEDARREEARREGLTAFLKIASHDLKNPLTVILSSAPLLRMVKTPEQSEKLIANIVRAGKRAQELIHSYLELASVESGKTLEVDWQPVDVRMMVEEEMEIVRAVPSVKVTFVNAVDEASGKADPAKIRQVLANLLSNAAKYSPQGGEVRVEGGAQNGELVLRVRDQGVGISEADQKKLFREFQRVGDRSVAEGTGLGLWLTAALVKSHGGKIWVESTPGQGTTFSFTIPQVPVPEPALS